MYRYLASKKRNIFSGKIEKFRLQCTTETGTPFYRRLSEYIRLCAISFDAQDKLGWLE